MPASITGKVFNDANSNGILDVGEVGIANVYVVIMNPNSVCTTVQTDSSGTYTFSGLNIAGNYTVYETAINPTTCPPNALGQPTGFINSTTFRTQTINVTQGQIDSNTIIIGNNYGHDNLSGFPCSNSLGYIVTIPPGSTNSQFVAINIVTGDATVLKSNLGYKINALGYNILNDMIYGIIIGTNNLVRISEDGTVTNLGAIPNLPNGITYNNGVIDDNGRFFIAATTGSSTSVTYYVIDINKNSPTFGQLLDPTAGYTLENAPYGTQLQRAFYFGDWAFNPKDGLLYAINITTGNVERINQVTRAVTTLTTTGLPAGAVFGSTFTDADGNLYSLSNTNGDFYRVLLSGNTANAQLFMQTLSSSNSDGASCIEAVIRLDFGDAPDTAPGQGTGNYRTLLSSDGPRHQIVNNLKLGIDITPEIDAYQNSTATADDISLQIFDDGTNLPLPIMARNATSYTFTEYVYNDTGQNAYVYAWIDFNKNGIFETNEGTTAIVPSSSTNPQSVTLTINVPAATLLTPGATFARVRVTTVPLENTGTLTTEDTRSYGPAVDGEVEDYEIIIDDTKIISTKTASVAYADFGDIITYTVTLNNPGIFPISNVLFTDAAPSGTIYNDNLTVNAPYTGTSPQTGITITNINPSETVTISWQVKVDNYIPNINPISNIGTVAINRLPTTSTPAADTLVQRANLISSGNFVKSVNKTSANLGDTLTYTLTLNNTGNVSANNIVITDPIPSGTSYVANSISSNVLFTGNPTSTINLTNPIAAGSSATISYQTLINATPIASPVLNTATVDYNYTVNPSNPNGATASGNSNTVSTAIVPVSISGVVNFDKNRSATIDTGDLGIANVPVVLQNTTTMKTLVVLTGLNGNYVFNNVPTGSYRIVEAYGITGGVSSPGDFSTAITESTVPVGKDPPLSFVANPPTGSTNLDSLSPNTRFVTVSNTNLTNENFLDGPVIYTPITSILDSCTNILSSNIITAADNGTFGSYSAGTSANTAPATAPYPNTISNFTYSPPYTNGFGSYTVINIMTGSPNSGWWRISNRTTGDEIGRAMILDGLIANAVIFKQTLSVTANTNYLFSYWALNINKSSNSPQPLLGFQVLDQNNNILIEQTPGSSIAPNTLVPNWVQIGSTFNSGNNTTITINLLSKSSQTSGNDFAIDDISLVEVDIPVFTPVKSVSKSIADIGDIVTYKTTLTNTCDSSLTNVTFQDTVPQGLSFVSGSVTINGNPNTTYNPNTGFNVPNIAGDSTVEVIFDAMVKSLPTTNNPTNNTSTMTYNYTPVQGGIANLYSEGSNLVQVQVNYADLISTGNFVKTVDKNYANIGDIITYTLQLTNSGNVLANNIVITDVIPIGTSYVAGSISGDVSFTGNPTTTINLTNPISVGASASISYGIVVNEIPSTNPIPNIASVAYTYTVNPANPNEASRSGNSNSVNTQINHADLISAGNFVKTVDKNYANIGDVITYTLELTNSGSTSANNIVITDAIPSGTSYVAGSINGDVSFTGNPTTTINLINPMPAGVSASISYEVTVNEIPRTNPIPNTASVAYKYTVNPASINGASGSGNSNTVNTQVNHADLISAGNFVKTVDKNYAKVGDILTYTLELTNSGNISANYIVITDVIPSGTSYVAGSISGDVSFIGNPTTTINLTNPIPAGASASISYGIVVNEIPSTNPIPNIASVAYKYTVNPANPNEASGSGNSNNVNTQINHADLISAGNFVKSASRQYAKVGDTITYTLTVTNTGSVPANNIVITDQIPSGASYVGVSISGNVAFTGSPLTTIVLTNPIAVGGSASINYSVIVNPITVIPNPIPNPIENIASIAYTYTVNPDIPNGANSNGNSNTVSTEIDHADLISNNNFTKSASTTNVNVGDIITYTLNITNIGNVPANNVVINDSLPMYVSYISGSIRGTVAFNGNPTTTITLTNPINAHGSVSISYNVKINKIPHNNQIINTADIAYTYTVDPANPNAASASGKSNSITNTHKYNREDAINILMYSIAMEEIGVSHIMNAEGEKLQYVIGTLIDKNGDIVAPEEKSTIKEVLAVNSAVSNTLKKIMKNQILLGIKLNDIIKK